jgi:hypothetical protein
MANYEPPTEIDPIFNSLAFQTPNNASITKAEADQLYLARTNVATSTASVTAFSGDVQVGNSVLDYTSGTGLVIRTTANGESMFLRTLSAGGATLQKIELNPTHMHLYDAVRVTESATPANYTLLQQAGTTATIESVVNTGTLRLRTRDTGGVGHNNIACTSAGVSLGGETALTGLNGTQILTALFGRNDTAANTFSGTLGYTRHPIGWTISASKAIAIPTSNVTVDVIASGTPTTVFNTLSNGVWRFGVTCNNSANLGTMTFAIMSYGAITGGSAINGTTGTAAGNLFHQTTAGLSNMGVSYPELIIRTTGNGTTGLVVNWSCTYSAQPTITFNMWAIKVA